MRLAAFMLEVSSLSYAEAVLNQHIVPTLPPENVNDLLETAEWKPTVGTPKTPRGHDNTSMRD